MNKLKEKEAEQRAKWFLFFTIASIFTEISIIIGFFIFAYFLIMRYAA